MEYGMDGPKVSPDKKRGGAGNGKGKKKGRKQAKAGRETSTE
jgi:hypothetical protein